MTEWHKPGHNSLSVIRIACIRYIFNDNSKTHNVYQVAFLFDIVLQNKKLSHFLTDSETIELKSYLLNKVSWSM